jgi:hypothetical protein
MKASKAAGRRLVLLALCWAGLAGWVPTARAQNASEYEVKAAYLYKLGQYVDWPAQSFPAPDSPVTLCVIGEDPFGPLLEKSVAGERFGTHPIAISRMATASRGAGCNIAYFGGSAQQGTAEGLAQLQGAPVLTITDADRKGEGTGIIHFVIKANRVRFDIDDQAAAQNGLQISAKLLSLASSVKPRK